MPDLPECILPPENDLEASQVQRPLRAAARELEAIERRLAALGSRLPEPAEPFELLGELRAAIDCVRGDLRAGASGFVLFHTHPSGDPTPSNADFAFTRRMQKAGEIMGVRLIDHVIVAGGDRWVSLRRRGV